jgi:hypothetical protein
MDFRLWEEVMDWYDTASAWLSTPVTQMNRWEVWALAFAVMWVIEVAAWRAREQRAAMASILARQQPDDD